MATDPRLGTYFQQLERQYQLPAGYLARTRYIESANGTRLKSPTGPEGDFQFTRKTAQAVGLPLAARMDPFASAEGAAKLAAQNKSILARALGRDPTGAELYMGHQQGAGGAAALLSNPNVASGALTDPNNIRVNAGDPSAPARSILAKFEQKFNNAKPDVPVAPLPPGTEIATRPIVTPGALATPDATPAATPALAQRPAPLIGEGKGLLGLAMQDNPVTMADVKGFLGSDQMGAGIKGLGMMAQASGEGQKSVYAPPPPVDTSIGGGDPTLLAALLAKRKQEQMAAMMPPTRRMV